MKLRFDCDSKYIGMTYGKWYDISSIREYKNTNAFGLNRLIKSLDDFDIDSLKHPELYYEVSLIDDDKELNYVELILFNIEEVFRDNIINGILI